MHECELGCSTRSRELFDQIDHLSNVMMKMHFAHFSDKPIAARTHRLNVFRSFGIVAKRLSQFGDFAGQRVRL